MFEIKIPFVTTVMSITSFYCHKYVYVGPESLRLCLLLVCVCVLVSVLTLDLSSHQMHMVIW